MHTYIHTYKPEDEDLSDFIQHTLECSGVKVYSSYIHTYINTYIHTYKPEDEDLSDFIQHTLECSGVKVYNSSNVEFAKVEA